MLASPAFVLYFRSTNFTWNKPIPPTETTGEEDEEVDDSELNLDKVEEEMAADYSGMALPVMDFKTRYTKLERFLHKNQRTQRKLLNFENWINGQPQ